MEKFDLIVIGGGSGLDVAAAAAEQGLKIAKGFDKDGNRKFEQTVTIPFDTEVIRELVEALESVV